MPLTFNRLISSIKDNLLTFLSISIFAIGVSFFIAFTASPVYKSTAKLMPSNNLESEYNSMSSNNVFQMAMGVGASETKTLETETLTSRDFFNYLIESKDMSELFIVEIDSTTGNFKYDPLYGSLTTNNGTHSQKLLYIAYLKYLEFFTVTPDKTSNIVRLSFKHVSPDLAFSWLTDVISELNYYLALKTKNKATISTKFLNELLSKTTSMEVRQAIASLLESQIKKSMLSENNNEYAYTVIDSPAISTEIDGPNRSLIIFLGILLGFIFSLIYAIFRSFK